MKKYILILAGLMILSFNTVNAKTAVTSPAVAEGIKLYKAQNYTQSYVKFRSILEKEPANSLAAYYYAMCSAQLGRKDDAIANYEKVIELSPHSILSKYARQGKKCLEQPERCHEPELINASDADTEEDRFIKGVFGTGFSEEAKSMYEKQKIENLKRDINRKEDIPTQRFKEFKDFSTQAPTNEEIVSALRTLQAAGLTDVLNTEARNSDISLMFGGGYNSNRGNYDMLNLLMNKQNGSSNIDPQLIQSLLTTQMTTSF